MDMKNVEKFLIGMTVDEALITISDCKIYHQTIQIVEENEPVPAIHIQSRLTLVHRDNVITDVYYG